MTAGPPSIPTVAGAPMAMVPAGVFSSAKTGTGLVGGRPVTCSQKVARRSTSWVITNSSGLMALVSVVVIVSSFLVVLPRLAEVSLWIRRRP